MMKRIFYLMGVCLLFANENAVMHPLQLPDPLTQPFMEDGSTDKMQPIGNVWVYSDENMSLGEYGEAQYHDGNSSVRMGNIHIFDSQQDDVLEGSLTTFGNRVFHESHEEPSFLPSKE